jgi:signal transduction histidine kinase
MWRWRADLAQSTAFRVSFINALLLLAALGGSFAASWLLTSRSVEADARARISIEAEALASELQVEGLDGVLAAIEWRTQGAGSQHYLLVDNGTAVGGDMETVPRSPGWHRFRWADHATGESREMLARVVRAQPGALIAVGEDLSASKAVRLTLFNVMAPVAIIALVLGTLSSIAATRRTMRRIEDIVAVVRSVEQGDFKARIDPSPGSPSDVETLAVAINRMLGRIEGLVGTLARMSAEIAHDLRTPLTHVRHALHSARWSEDGAERMRSLEKAAEGTTNALHLFDAMLKLAELDSGQFRAAFAPVDMSATASRVIDAYSAEIESSGRTVEWLGADDCRVRGDADLLTQAVANLIDNALKHTPPGASIKVRASCAEGQVCVAVEDDGPGIAPSEIETILRPFGRLDKARSTPGSGLGLAIANSIAKLHGGKVHVRNLDPGLSIGLELPQG